MPGHRESIFHAHFREGLTFRDAMEIFNNLQMEIDEYKRQLGQALLANDHDAAHRIETAVREREAILSRLQDMTFHGE